jgi:hypothetical protein
MPRPLRILLILFACGALVVAGSGVALAATVVRSGVITVHVSERSSDGVHLFLPVPAALVELGAGTLPLWMPDDELARMRRHIGPWQPALRAAARALEECPDAVLVSVESRSERVRVTKDGDTLDVEVHSADADVHVSLPADALSRVLDALS